MRSAAGMQLGELFMTTADVGVRCELGHATTVALPLLVIALVFVAHL